ncbi:hypothetical protein Q5752_002357 [Cryptotrichosporon argae]
MFMDHGAHMFPSDRSPALFAPTPTHAHAHAHCRPALVPAYTSPYLPSAAHKAVAIPVHAATPLAPSAAPLASSSASASATALAPASASASASASGRLRPKMPKKASSSVTKARAVQCALEVKVEKAKGFHAFFVPLARAVPPAPPSSPVGHRDAERAGAGDYFYPQHGALPAHAHAPHAPHAPHPSAHAHAHAHAHVSPGVAQRHARHGLLEPSPVPAGAVLQQKLASEERWVEHAVVGQEDGMEIDPQ